MVMLSGKVASDLLLEDRPVPQQMAVEKFEDR
jgi:hypothetical protein